MGLFAREYQGPPADLLPPGDRADLDARAARRTVRFFAVAVFVLVVGAVFAFTVTRERYDKNGSSSSSNRPTTTSPAAAAAAEASIGPDPGTELGPYLDERKAALAQVTDDRLAVLSLESYVSEADARAKVGSLPVDALLVAAPGGRPSVVSGGLDAWAKTQRQADQMERNEIAKLLPTFDNDPVFKAFYEGELVRLDAAIANVSPTSEVVFGLVVRAPAETLKKLGATAGVRLVDVGHAPIAAPGAVYQALRPEETARAGEPDKRPV